MTNDKPKIGDYIKGNARAVIPVRVATKEESAAVVVMEGYLEETGTPFWRYMRWTDVPQGSLLTYQEKKP